MFDSILLKPISCVYINCVLTTQYMCLFLIVYCSNCNQLNQSNIQSKINTPTQNSMELRRIGCFKVRCICFCVYGCLV
uniref:Uncharacterized protein n=1 Tax=Cannabis sativa TaxID=3483 RepID=A0A803RCD9_CANSA